MKLPSDWNSITPIELARTHDLYEVKYSEYYKFQDFICKQCGIIFIERKLSSNIRCWSAYIGSKNFDNLVVTKLNCSQILLKYVME